MDIASSSRAEAKVVPGRPRWIGLAVWLAAAAACTFALWLYRERLPTAHMALAYLLVVLLGSARQGRVVGLVLSVVCFVSFNFFLLPPYYTFALHDPLNWWVLAAFLITGAVAAELFHRAQRALEESESRARVLDRLAAVGAESLAAPRAADAVRAIARVILTELGVASCRIVVLEPSGLEPVIEPDRVDAAVADRELVEYSARELRLLGLRRDGTSHVGTPDATLLSMMGLERELRALLVPLQVRAAAVGVLVLEDPSGLFLPPGRSRLADALVHYAALAVERVRLTAASEHVEVLREADRLKDALLASVSHDLRTPLTTIRALGAELRETGDERAAVIEEEAERLNRMVADLLDLSRIRGDAIPLEPQLIAAEDLVGAVLQRLGGLSAGDRVDVRLPPGGALPVGRFDFVQALRALGNLIENALRHSPNGGPVELEVAEEAGELVFRVLDRSSEVPESERERIFEPFFRGSGARAGGGTGLGLTIARSLAEAQDGSVRHRPRPGGGNCFELRLPAGTVTGI